MASPMVSIFRRIVLLGKTGAGKSSVGNNILGGEKVFHTSSSSCSFTERCTSRSRISDGRKITLVDTPGFFDTRMSEDELEPEIINCMTESAGGVHAFLIVLKVERYTVHEREIITKIKKSFSDEAFKYATVLFTHGDDLEGKTIQEFVNENKELHELVQKCGGRCHVVDNKHWNQGQQDENSINQIQVSELLKTIDQTVEQNGGGCYTNEMLQAVEEEIQAEEKPIREKSGGKLSEEEIHSQAKEKVKTKLSVKLAGTGTGALLGAVLGVGTAALLALSIIVLVAKEEGPAAEALKVLGSAGGGTAASAATWLSTAAEGLLSPAKCVLGTAALAGAVGGGIFGAEAAEGKETAGEAIEAAATAVHDKAKPVWIRWMIWYRSPTNSF